MVVVSSNVLNFPFLIQNLAKIYWGKDKSAEHVNYKGAKAFGKQFSYHEQKEISNPSSSKSD